ncbi:MAG: hypothetical protein Q8Q47_07255 [Ignavibacteriaceae bacterium]|jgi:uncharacterized membrane protein YkvI|nr:hypothetical protein [Ignavibacteriaceae bacterium]
MLRTIGKFPTYQIVIFSATFLFSGCAIIEGVFEIGLWTGVIIVSTILGLILLGARWFKK